MKAGLVLSTLVLFGLVLSQCATVAVGDEKRAAETPELKADQLGATKNVHTYGLNMLCGQPTAEEFAEAKRRGIQRVITLRQPGEIDWDQKGELNKLGLEFHELGFRSPETLTDELLDKARKLLSEKDQKPVMMHCGSANRVGAVWAAHRALDGDLSIEEALAEAKKVGLRSADYEKVVVEYIQKRKSESQSGAGAK